MADTTQSTGPEEGSVTHWLEGLKRGDQHAVANLCNRYYRKLMELARSRMGDGDRTVVDEEDIANSVLATVCRNAQNGRFPELADRHQLWHLLLKVTRQKVATQKRDAGRLKRGSKVVSNMTDLRQSFEFDEEEIFGIAPLHEMLATASDLAMTMLAQFQDPLLRDIAAMKLDGMTNQEVSEQLGISARSVSRKMRLIRTAFLSYYAAHLGGESPDDGQEAHHEND
jgi:DNA-directed RNA polymerase specialized sigma24 family protein